jgi:predicted dehydrogenase
MAAMGVHLVDTFHYFAGAARRVMAFSRKATVEGTLDRATIVLIEYLDGTLASIGTSSFTPPIQLVAAFGTRRDAWNEHDGLLFTQGRDDRDRVAQPVDELDTIVDELQEFAACILGERAPETGGREGLEVAAVMEGMSMSLDTGTPTLLADLR